MEKLMRVVDKILQVVVLIALIFIPFVMGKEVSWWYLFPSGLLCLIVLVFLGAAKFWD